ncbi:glutamate-gated chloride channel-like protein [Leptotrombidium deliense]|uniref:Glutamate-gated chloride channel-like protein n=1 Tax=Leptotrombidium deliense TaxID=299467 RepID=A0A443SF16_9ACAR|nr:glutamate-gated chloride channel-like protein [Leptotrombidium deliense]
MSSYSSNNLLLFLTKLVEAILYNYNAEEMPVVNETADVYDPIIVTHDIFVRTCCHIDDEREELELILTYNMQWNDSRLQFYDYNGKIPYLQFINSSKIWTPHTYFSNEVDGKFYDILKPNSLIRIYPNGEVKLSGKVSLTLSCPIDFRYFPKHTFECALKIANGNTINELFFKWKKENEIQVTKSLTQRRYSLRKVDADICHVHSMSSTESYTCLRAIFTFDSIDSIYWRHIYKPCAMLLLISFVTLWIYSEHWKSRIFISLISFALFVIKISFTENEIPKRSYSTSHDYWSFWATFLSFFTAVESIIVCSIKYRIMTTGEHVGKHVNVEWTAMKHGRMPELKSEMYARQYQS